jgi:hypothetical protein
MIYRYSPNEGAQPRHFVLGNVIADVPLTEGLRARMKHDPHIPKTVCPYSGTVADDGAFAHPEDQKAALEIVKHEAAQDIGDAFTQMFKDAFKGSKNIKFTPGRPSGLMPT